MSKTLLLLASPSRESRDKALHLSEAAKALNVPCGVIIDAQPDRAEARAEILAGDEPILLAIACSDALALPAARLNDRHDCGGLSASLIGQLVDKATGIPLLSRILDLPLLPQCLPLTPDEIMGWSWSGPVFVKPTRSSGGWSPQPWGYRRFDSKMRFMQWLQAENLETAFFARQRQPDALGPSLLQAALNTNRSEGALLLLTSSRLQIVSNNHADFERWDTDAGCGPCWHRASYGGDAMSELPGRLSQLKELRGLNAAWGRGLIYVQGLRGLAGLSLIDVNLRLSTTWDWMAAAADPTAHRRLLAALLFDEPLDLPLPAPAVAIDLVNGDPKRRIQSIDHPPLPPHIRPVRLTAEACGRPAGGFDKAGVMPSFVTLGPDLGTCLAEADRFRAGITVHYAPESAAKSATESAAGAAS